MKKAQKVYGYVRVSSRDQNESRQLIALEGYHISPKNLFVDKQSGKDFERPAYQKMIRRIQQGDLLILASIDRLGRNYEEILYQWRYLVKDKGIDIMVLDMPLLDTSKNKDLLGTFISDLVLQLLSYIAESERNMIRRRQREGIDAAKERGVRFGRPPISMTDEFTELINEWKEKKRSAKEVAQRLDVSVRTVYNYARKME